METFFVAMTEPTIDFGFERLKRLVPRHPGDPSSLNKVWQNACIFIKFILNCTPTIFFYYSFKCECAY